MKELLYIPSGRYVKFYPEDEFCRIKHDDNGELHLTWSIQELVDHRKKHKEAANRYFAGKFLSYEEVIEFIMTGYMLEYQREHAEIPTEIELLHSEFEVVDV